MVSIVLFVLLVLILTYPFFEIYRYRKESSDSDDINFELKQALSIILCVYNEERNIQHKIDELLNEPIWVEGSELLIISGGSTDQTDQIIKNYSHDKRIKAYFFPTNISKIEAINFAVKKSFNDILVFSDCRQVMKHNSVVELVKLLETKKVDVVAATLKNKNDKKNNIRDLINRMNLAKSKNSNSMNIYGALYAQRKSAFKPIPTNVLFDDLYVLASTLAQKKKIIQSDKAIIEDAIFVNYYQKERIQRLTRGLLLFIFRHHYLLFKMKFSDLFHFIMSKYSKLFVPSLFFILLLNLILELVVFQTNRLSDFCLMSILLLFFLTGKALLFIKLNYYTFTAQFNYIFKNKRSIRWEKFKNY